MNNDLLLVQLLSSRICHDLIGPAGTLNFSIEMLKDNEEISIDETLSIATSSISNLIHRLSYFRMCFGKSSFAAYDIGLRKAKELIFNLFQEKELTIVWGDDSDSTILKVVNNDNLKLLLNIFLIIFYVTNKSSLVEVMFAEISPKKVGVAIFVKGSSTKLGIDNMQALRLEVDPLDLTPHNVHSYYTALIADALGAELSVRENMQEEIQIAFLLKENT